LYRSKKSLVVGMVKVAEKKVTHQGSLLIEDSVIFSSEASQKDSSTFSTTNTENNFLIDERICCSQCGVSCGPFARLDFIRRSRLIPSKLAPSKGVTNDIYKRNRIRGYSIIQS
jgi:hypothetical protein